jgi:tRNA U34 5-carboxymethylaminomethyl modifying enzyme MnmG/GidA
LKKVQTSEVNARTRIAALISRPQVELGDLFNYVPCGTFSKNNIDLDAEFASPLDSILCDGVEYSDLLQYGDKSDFSKKSNSIYPDDISYADAAYVLQFNTEYPVSALDSEKLDNLVSDNYKREILDSSEISIKYKGYIQREKQMADKIMRLENLNIPEDFDFDKVESLSIECRQKLKKYSPRTIAQASRISGVSPADISVLLVYFGR